MRRVILIATVLICAATLAWAQNAISVSTDSELRAAITNGANITVTSNIYLSNSTLSIPTGYTVTIDLNGYVLDRGLGKRGDGGGQVITVRQGATLNLSNGTLKGGWGGNAGGLSNESGTAHLTNVNITGCKGDDAGGGICNLGGTLTMTGGSITNNICYDHGDIAGGGGLFNAEEAKAMLTGVTITGNVDMVCGGGGICNHGTLYLDGCTIQNNTARTCGGGIWSGNEKHRLKIQGANIITDNTAGGITSNLYMEERRWITLTGSITGSQIGVSLAVTPNQFTDSFPAYHSGEDPNTFFFCDRPETDSLALVPDEPYVHYIGDVMVVKKNLDGKVPYIECSWDDTNKKVVSTTKILPELIDFDSVPTNETQYKKLQSSDSYVNLGTQNSALHEYYVVEDDEVNISALFIVGPNVHLILCDNAWLHLENDLYVPGGSTVYLHAQSTGSFMGKMTSGGGIGGNPQDGGANIEIHGGNFDLQGSENCAAIGGKYETNGDITIYSGRIKATGGNVAAGIGSGYGCTNYGNIFIYGGKIDATGSAGIGGGEECLNGNLTIWDGAITAHGQNEAAGIGSNQFSGDYGAGTITINGGYVRAYGDQYAAGIGGGDGIRGGTLNVNGGRVEAYGGTDAAGIGGGEGGNGGIVNINGGYVYAEGNDNGAGIGGGEDGAGADVTITGGVVIAKAGWNDNLPCAIGRGSDADNSDGQLDLADNLGVFISTNLYRSQKANRVSDCRNNRYVQINKCAHGGATVSIVDGHKHAITDCQWCFSTAEEAHTFGEHGECPVCHLIGLSDKASNTGTISHWAIEAGSHDVTLAGRTLYKDDSWNTLCLPFNMPAAEVTAKLAPSMLKELDITGQYSGHQTGYDAATGTLYLYFKDTTVIEAGKPYIIKWGSDTYVTNPLFSSMTMTGANPLDVTSQDNKVTFRAIYDPTHLEKDDKSNLYLGAGDQLYWPDEDVTVNAFRSYFLIDLSDTPSGAPELRIVTNFTGEDTTTGIEDVRGQMSDVRGEKFMLNQFVLIRRGDAIYDLQGHKLSTVNSKQ